MYTTTLIGSIGERAVVADLERQGATVTSWDTAGLGSTDVEAWLDGRRILIQVKTALGPRKPGSLSKRETAALRVRAFRLGASALRAAVVLDRKGLHVRGAIAYFRVN
jgi:hypothetical protein